MEAPAGNSDGFSLIEMLIAVVIIALTLLALCSAMANAISANLGNELRNTAVRLTNQTAEVLLALPIDSIQSCGMTADPDARNYDVSYTYNSTNACLGIARRLSEISRPPAIRQGISTAVQYYLGRNIAQRQPQAGHHHCCVQIPGRAFRKQCGDL